MFGLVAFCFLCLFISLDLNKGSLTSSLNYCDAYENFIWEQYQNGEITQDEWYELYLAEADTPLNQFEIRCLILGEIFEPFIWLSGGLMIAFFILAMIYSKK